MSGGHFQHAYYHPGNFADELKMELDTADEPDEPVAKPTGQTPTAPPKAKASGQKP